MNDLIKYILESKQTYEELKTKYNYDIYLTKLKTIPLQINENNILCAIDVLATKRYTRFPLLFKEILKNPNECFLPTLNKYQMNILKKRIIDGFLINYYISNIPKKKVDFIFSRGILDLEIINEVRISLISDFLNVKILDVDILFLDTMNLGKSHNLVLSNLINYHLLQKQQQCYSNYITSQEEINEKNGYFNRAHEKHGRSKNV